MIFRPGLNLSRFNGNAPLYDKSTFQTLVTLGVACFFYGLSAGINISYFSLYLSKFSLSSVEISNILSLEILGNISMAPFMIILTKKLGLVRLMNISLILRNIFLLIFGFGATHLSWNIGMIGFGVFGFSLYAAIFQKINIIAVNKYRGTYISVATVLFGFGIAIGPIVIALLEIGIDSAIFTVSVLLSFVMLIPINLLHDEPYGAPSRSLSIPKIIQFSYIPILCAISSEFVFFSILEYLPLYSLEYESGQSEAYMLVSYFSLSGLVLGIPFGMLIDRFDRMKMIMVFSLFIAAFVQLIPLVINDGLLIFLVFSPLSACINGVLIAGLALLGDKLYGEDFIAANSIVHALSMIGGYMGVQVTGNMIDVVGTQGMIYSVAAVFLVFFAMMMVDSYMMHLKYSRKSRLSS